MLSTIVSTMLFITVVETGENTIDKLVRYCYRCCSTLLTVVTVLMVEQRCNIIVYIMAEQPC